jgi:glycosyltransferase involved in cell wall biosynthesis
MKIVHFLSSIGKTSGGITTYLELLSRGLKKEVELVIATGFSHNPIKIEGVRVVFFNRSLKNLTRTTKEYRLFLIHENPDIVHINGIWKPLNWLFQKQALKLGIKVVLSPHGMLEPYILNRNRWKKQIAMFLYQNKAIKNADYIHATAIPELNNIKKLGYKNKYIMIPNGVDISESLIKTNYKENNRVFLFLSRIHPKKGIELLLEAIKKTSKENFSVIIAGTGDEKYIKSLISLTKNYKIENRVSFVGAVYGKEKWQLYKQVDCFILPTHSENFGIVIAEALATGVPVITTTGTPWSELNEFDCGWWIDLSVDTIKDTIEKALSLSANELSIMGSNGRNFIKEKYEIKSVTQNMYEFYKKINQIKSN